MSNNVYKNNEWLNKCLKDSGLSIDKFMSGIGKTRVTYYNWIKKGGIKYESYKLIVSKYTFVDEGVKENIQPQIETFETKNNRFKTLNGITVIQVPVIPVKAYAQYIDEFYNEASDITFEMANLEVDHFGLGNYLAFDVAGDSMNGGLIDDTPDGARVLAREIGQHLWRGGLYKSKHGHIIITNKNILFKDIVDFNQDEMKVTLHSRNTSPEYTDFKMRLGYCDTDDHVLQIFKVLKRFNM